MSINTPEITGISIVCSRAYSGKTKTDELMTLCEGNPPDHIDWNAYKSDQIA